MGSEVAALGYVVITAEDLDAWQSFAESVLGLQVGMPRTSEGEHETLYLRMDDRRWRVAVERGPNGGLAALGFELVHKAALERLKDRLVDGGFAVKDAPEVAEQRQVIELFRVEDPSGHPLEFFYGGRTDTGPFVSPVGVRFVTGAQGLGHAVLMVSDIEKTRQFYVDLLSFRLTDVFVDGPVSLYFTSPNPRHHSLAFGSFPNTPPMLQHINLQVDDIDSLGRGLDRVYDTGAKLLAGLGRHSNDHMISFYCGSPSGLAIEYGWGGRVIDDAVHTTGYYDSALIWGYRQPDGTRPHSL